MARLVLVDPRGSQTESFRHFALRVRRELKHQRLRSVFVTSGVHHEGKTTTASNLALALASMTPDRRIALAELDLRRPSISRALGVAPHVGIEQVLLGAADLGAARLRVENLALDLFLAIEPVPEPHEILARPQLAAVVRDLANRYDVVVFDTPPLLPVPDVELIAVHVDAGVAVVRAGATSRSSFRALLKQPPAEKLIGVFLNDAALPHYAKQSSYYAKDDNPSATE